MSAIPHYYREYLIISAFWIFIVGLDLICLWSLRRSRIEATARVLWVVWIIIAPIIGAISYYIVQPTPVDEGIRRGDGPFQETGRQQLHWNEQIQR